MRCICLRVRIGPEHYRSFSTKSGWFSSVVKKWQKEDDASKTLAPVEPQPELEPEPELEHTTRVSYDLVDGRDIKKIPEDAWKKNDEACKKAVTEMKTRKWSPRSKRTGLIGIKMGMLHVWDHWGRQIPLTVIKVDNTVVMVKTNQILGKGLVGMQLGMGEKRAFKALSKAMFHHYLNQGVTPKKRLMEFLVTRDGVLPVGWKIDPRHFVPGQYVDVKGITIGKGTQGAMKKWGFSGLPASHGVSIAHRSLGSVSRNKAGGQVWPGTHMHGRMGNLRKTVQNLQVYKIDPVRKLLYLKGPIPGFSGNWVRVKDAVKSPFTLESPPPFPTFIPSENEDKEKLKQMELVAPPDSRGDPFVI